MEMTQKKENQKGCRNIIVHAAKLENGKFTERSIVLALLNAFSSIPYTATEAQ
jgi:hypothetical protein